MRRGIIRPVALLVAVALLAAGCVGGGGGNYSLTGVFEDGTGIFPASPVRLRGVDVGQVTDIRTGDGLVEVDFTVDDGVSLPSDTGIVIIPLTLLGERYLQLMPGESATDIEAGSVIPVERTGKPAELDELLEGLEDFVAALDEEQASRLLVNLADVLEDNGSELNDLIANGAHTVDLLADSADDLNTIVSALATLNETVASRSQTIQDLVRNYNSLSGALAANQDALSGTVTELDDSLLELARLLVDNEQHLTDSVETLTQAARTLDRNHESISDLLRYTVDLFAAADLAYNRENNWLPLNNHAPPETFSTFIAHDLANRLAGICRRLDALVGPGTVPELVACGEGGGAVEDLIDDFPGIVDDLLSGGASLPTAQDAAAEATLITGLSRILELVPDLDQRDVEALEDVSAENDQALIDLVEQHAPEDVPEAVAELLRFLRGEPEEEAAAETQPSDQLHEPPPRRTLDQVYEELEDLLEGAL